MDLLCGLCLFSRDAYALVAAALRDYQVNQVQGADTLKSDALLPLAAPSCCGVAPLGLYWAAFASPQPLPERLG